MSNDLTSMRITSFEVKTVAGEWKETTRRWMSDCQRNKEIANLAWEAWSVWHAKNGSRDKLREWLTAREEKGVKAAGKCPVEALPAVLSKGIYREAVMWAPEMHTRDVVLLLNTIQQTMKSRKAAKGNLPGHSAILLLQEARPSFTRPYPILFDRANCGILPATPEDGKNFRFWICVNRIPRNGTTAESIKDVLTLRCTGANVRSQLAILKRIDSGEKARNLAITEVEARYKSRLKGAAKKAPIHAVYKAAKRAAIDAVESCHYILCGSQLVWSQGKRKWFVRICYRMTREAPAPLDPERSAVFYARKDWPFSLLLPDRRRMPGGRGRYIAPVRRQLLIQRWNRQANYRNAGQCNKGHGRTRAGAGPQWKLQQRWKDFCKRVNHGFAREAVEACAADRCGRLVFYQPESDWGASRFLSNAGKVAGRSDSTGWPWFQLKTFLEQKCEEKGIELLVIKRQGRGLRSVKTLQTVGVKEDGADSVKTSAKRR